MGAIGHDGLAVPGRVELAHEPPFDLGPLSVDPARLQLERNNERLTIEPRVMQTLVALYRASGIVTRDELIGRCWSGRAVSDDAINRVIARLRKIAAGIGRGAFAIETVPRVGYRLIEESTREERPGPPRLNEEVPRSDRRAVLVGAGAVAAVAIVGMSPLPTLFRGVPTEAEALYERALAIGSSSTNNSTETAIPLLQEAVRIAPDYGDAWGALAIAYLTAMDDNPASRDRYQARFDEALAKAKLYSPKNPRVAVASLPRDGPFGRWQSFEPAYRGLIREHPDYYLGHSLLGSLLMNVGRWHDSLEPLRNARRLDPFSPLRSYHLTVALWSAGRPSEAQAEIESAVRRWPRHSAIWQTRLKILALSGQPDSALALLSDREDVPVEDSDAFSNTFRLVATALKTGQNGDRAAAVAALRQGADEAAARVPAALYLAALGERPSALDLLEDAYVARKDAGMPAAISTHPLFQPQARRLWPEPRFRRILAATGLERYWRDMRVIPDFRRA